LGQTDPVGAKTPISNQYALCDNIKTIRAYGLSIGTDIGDLE